MSRVVGGQPASGWEWLQAWKVAPREQRDLSPGAVRLALAMLGFCTWKTGGDIFPSRDRLAEAAMLTPSKVSNAASELVAAGWLIRDRQRFGQATRYQLAVPVTEDADPWAQAEALAGVP